MKQIKAIAVTLLLIAMSGATVHAQYGNSRGSRAERASAAPRVTLPAPDSTVAPLILNIRDGLGFVTDTTLTPYDLSWADTPLPDYFFKPPVYEHFAFLPEENQLMAAEAPSTDAAMPQWLATANRAAGRMEALRHNFFFAHPELARYNMELLPEAPTQFVAVVDPRRFTIEIREMPKVNEAVSTLVPDAPKYRNWIRVFSVGLQFSQAYVSPNWYQGGNNNLNVLGAIFYNVKLNQEIHPNLLFETTAQYKLGMNSAPDDSIHSYSISDDLFQVNSTFGIKAARHWYYSLNAQFKTQFLNSYTSNTRDLRSSFLSPGELTAGLGMTYNYLSENKRVAFDASIAPVSYNLKTCTNPHIDPGLYGIEPGHKTLHSFGSSTELKLGWQIASNITLKSRLWAFTDYKVFQADWENTVNFDINRFLTTQIYCHLRYDSSTPRVPDTKWRKLQVKEILSIGFTYKFSTI